MIFNFFSIIVMLLLFWSLGRIIVHFIQYDEKFECLYAVIGSAVVVLFTTILYFLINLKIPYIRIVWVFVFTICIIYQFFNRIKIRRSEFNGLFCTVLLLFVLIIPGVIHKDQYYVYRGNFWDYDIYASEAFLGYEFSWKEVLASNGILPNDVYKFGYYVAICDRPSAAFVYALLLVPGVGNFFWLVYLYHVMFLSMVFCPLFEFSKQLIKNFSHQAATNSIIRFIPYLFASTYILGYWGQLQFDINALSHLCTIAIFISYFYMVYLFFDDVIQHRENKKYVCDFRLLILMNIVMIGGIMYYLENWIIQYMLSGTTIIFMCVLYKYKPRLKQMVCFITIPMTSLLAALICSPQLIRLLINEFSGAKAGTVENYGSYWTNWLQGFWKIEGIPNFAKIPAFLLSSFGMGHFVPYWGKGIISYVWAIMMLIISLLLICNIAFRLYRIFKCEITSERFLSATFICATLLSVIIYFKIKEYGFAKYIMYISPYTWILSCISIIYGLDRKRIYNIKNICALSAISVILSAVVFFAFRCYDTVYNDKANGYSYLSYPADQDPQLKDTHVFNFDAEKLGGADVVELEAEFPFYLYYMKLSTLYAGKEYYCAENHVLYSTEDELMEKPDKIDMRIYLERNSDGRLEPVYEKVD